jgi:sugar fermentation stimulation protein A
MQFEQSLIEGRLIRRYKRFLADVKLDQGDFITAHTPNTGSMRGCAEPGSRVWLSDSGNPKRKYPFSWEIVESNGSVLVGINTLLSNHLVQEAIESGVIEELKGYAHLRREVRYGNENSRIDLLLQGNAIHPDCYVEVKNVTMVDKGEEGVARFPDAVSDRGTRHLRELMVMVEEGYRAVLLFCVQRGDAMEVRPADQIDPLYGDTLREAASCGVEVYAYRAHVTPREIILERPLPVVIAAAG